MKIIEGMRRIKLYKEKIEALRAMIASHCADYDIQDTTYSDQAGQIRSWLNEMHDTLAEIERLKYRISKTNIATQVVIDLGGHTISKTISEWINRRDTLAKLELAGWKSLTDLGLKQNQLAKDPAGETRLVKVRLHFDPKQRDEKIALFSAEPHLIDGSLEVTNATTDLLD